MALAFPPSGIEALYVLDRVTQGGALPESHFAL
jgi:hypothetical protein